MKLSSVLGALASGSVLYLAMAACSASDGSHGPAASEATDEAGASSGGLLDAITNPVPSATAAPETSTRTVSTEPCDKTYVQGGLTWRYATHDYPGATAADLAHVVVLIDYGIASSVNRPNGYNQTTAVPMLRDGSAAFICGVDGQSATLASVTFIRP